MRTNLVLLLGVFLLIPGGCSDDKGETIVNVVEGEVPEKIVIVGGNGQSGDPDSVTGSPLMVRVLSENDRPMENVRVFFEAPAPHQLEETFDLTDANGVAFTSLRFGDLAGTFTVEAIVPEASGSPVSFNLTTTGLASAVVSRTIGKTDLPGGFTNIGSISGDYLHQITMVGDLAYIPKGSGGNGMIIADLQSAANPEYLTTVTGFKPRDIAVDGNLLCGVSTSVLTVLDISDTGSPQILGDLDMKSTAGSSIISVALEGTTAFVTGGGQYYSSSSALHSFDLSDPSNPLPGVGSAEMKGADIALKGDRAYVASYDEGLRIYDISNPLATLPLVGVVGTGGTASGLVMQGDMIYVWNFSETAVSIGVVDISVPGDPTLLKVVPIPDLWFKSHYAYGESFYGMAAEGNRVMFGGNVGVIVLDVSDPAAPAPLGRVDPRSYIGGVAPLGSGQWAVAWYQSLEVIEVDDVLMD